MHAVYCLIGMFWKIMLRYKWLLHQQVCMTFCSSETTNQMLNKKSETFCPQVISYLYKQLLEI